MEYESLKSDHPDVVALKHVIDVQAQEIKKLEAENKKLDAGIDQRVKEMEERRKALEVQTLDYYNDANNLKNSLSVKDKEIEELKNAINILKRSIPIKKGMRLYKNKVGAEILQNTVDDIKKFVPSEIIVEDVQGDTVFYKRNDFRNTQVYTEHLFVINMLYELG